MNEFMPHTTYVRRYSKKKIVVFIGIFTSMFFYTLDAWNE